MSESLAGAGRRRTRLRRWVVGTAICSLALFGAWYALSSILMSASGLPFAPWAILLPLELVAAITGAACAGLLAATSKLPLVVVGVCGIVACALICLIDVGIVLRIGAILSLQGDGNLWIYAAWIGLAIVPTLGLLAGFWRGGMPAFGDGPRPT